MLILFLRWILVICGGAWWRGAREDLLSRCFFRWGRGFIWHIYQLPVVVSTQWRR
uniref:Transmembrane protein n=1 Tax=Medicago truncatula TaxID=3880 RepID=I3S4Z4_MEDTR|nr:unknown [Medicago truncatula]